MKPPVTRCSTPSCPFLGRWAAGYCPVCLPSTTPKEPTR